MEIILLKICMVALIIVWTILLIPMEWTMKATKHVKDLIQVRRLRNLCPEVKVLKIGSKEDERYQEYIDAGFEVMRIRPGEENSPTEVECLTNWYNWERHFHNKSEGECMNIMAGNLDHFAGVLGMKKYEWKDG